MCGCGMNGQGGAGAAVGGRAWDSRQADNLTA